MKKALLVVLCAGFLNTAFAKDSTWKLCVGDVVLYEETVKLVVNVFEHRNGSDGRKTDLTMIYGGNVLKGGFDSTESDAGTVILKENESFYRGRAAVDYTNETLALKGTLSLFGSTTPINATISCETLAN